MLGCGTTRTLYNFNMNQCKDLRRAWNTPETNRKLARREESDGEMSIMYKFSDCSHPTVLPFTSNLLHDFRDNCFPSKTQFFFQYMSCSMEPWLLLWWFQPHVASIFCMFPMKMFGTMLHLCDFTSQQQELLQILRTPKESWGPFRQWNHNRKKRHSKKGEQKGCCMRLWTSENESCDNLWHLKSFTEN